MALYHYMYLLIENLYFQNATPSQLHYTIKRIHGRVWDQVTVIILSHFLAISNWQDYVDYFIYDNCTT